MASVTFGDPDDFNPFFKHWNARIIFVATRDAIKPVNEMDACFIREVGFPVRIDTHTPRKTTAWGSSAQEVTVLLRQ